MKRFVKWVLVLAVLTLAAFTAFAQEVTEDVGPVKINWSSKEMVFTGDGAPNLNAPNAASARLGAERAAYMDALRKALEAMKGIKIRAGQTVGQKLASNPSVAGEVEGVLRGFKAVDKRYYSDGGVQIDMRIPLDGVLVKTIMKDEMKAAPVAAKPEPPKAVEPPAKPAEPEKPTAVAKPETPAKPAEPEKPTAVVKPETPAKPEAPVVAVATGLVVLANKLRVIPVLAPKLIDEDGKDVYDVTMVSETGMDNGIISYVKDEEIAVKDKKIGGNPLIVSALSSPNSVDLVISNSDAEKIRKMAATSPFLSEGRVIVVKN